MAIIQSGATPDLWTIDPVSKAGRVTQYDSTGKEMAPFPTGAYMLPVSVRQTAASVAGTTVWAMRNGASKSVFFRRALLEVIFDGTAALATTLKYNIVRFSAATPTGGTALTVIKAQNTFAGSTIADARFLDTGLTTTGVVFETEWLTVGAPASVSAQAIFFQVPFFGSNEQKEPFVLQANEGLAIRLNTAAVVGFGVTGMVHWDER